MSVSVSFVRFLKLSMIYENIINYDPKKHKSFKGFFRNFIKKTSFIRRRTD